MRHVLLVVVLLLCGCGSMSHWLADEKHGGEGGAALIRDAGRDIGGPFGLVLSGVGTALGLAAAAVEQRRRASKRTAEADAKTAEALTSALDSAPAETKRLARDKLRAAGVSAHVEARRAGNGGGHK